GARELGAVPDRAVRVRLGVDGAGGDAAGARHGAGPARPGFVTASRDCLDGQRLRGGRWRAAGDAFGAGAGAYVTGVPGYRPRRVAVGAGPLEIGRAHV